MHASGRRRDDKKQLQRLQSKMSLPERLIELRALPADLPVLGQTSLRRARCQKTALPSAKRSASEVKMFRHRSRRRRCPPPRLSPADQPTIGCSRRAGCKQQTKCTFFAFVGPQHGCQEDGAPLRRIAKGAHIKVHPMLLRFRPATSVCLPPALPTSTASVAPTVWTCPGNKKTPI